jgi:hypothetical protein
MDTSLGPRYINNFTEFSQVSALAYLLYKVTAEDFSGFVAWGRGTPTRSKFGTSEAMALGPLVLLYQGFGD